MPYSLELVAPEVDQLDGGELLSPEDANYNHLIPTQEHMEESGHHLSINFNTKNMSRNERADIIVA